MLILTRKHGQSIIIDDVIEVKILGNKGDQIRLGINAPKEIAVDRSEIHERKKMFPDFKKNEKGGENVN